MSTNSRFADAVHVLSLMAWSGEEPLKSEQVAESVNTHPVVIRRMLLELAEAGLVVSQTGSLGGSRLANDPAKTTLLDIYRALECGGVFSLHRQPPSRDCPVGVNIETVLGEVLQEVDSAVEQVLGKITINELPPEVVRPSATPAQVYSAPLQPGTADYGVNAAGAPAPLRDVERQQILAALEKTGWHRGKTAEILGISPSTLYRRLRDYDLERRR